MKNDNFDDIHKQMLLLQKQIRNGVNLGIYNTLKQIKEEVIVVSNQPKSGRVYVRRATTSKGKTRYSKHQASAPNEGYAKDTGETNKNIKYLVKSLKGQIGVNDKLQYPKIVELGGKHLKARKTFASAGHKIVKNNLQNNIINGMKYHINKNNNGN